MCGSSWPSNVAINWSKVKMHLDLRHVFYTDESFPFNWSRSNNKFEI